MSSRELLETGVVNLDLLLGGGIPAQHSLIVTGDPGTGKTILCSQIAFQRAARGKRVVIATVASESQDKLMAELGAFSFYDPELIGKEVFIVSAYPWLQQGVKEARELLLRTLRDQDADMLFMDGLRSLRDLWGSDAKIRDFLYELNVGLAQHGATALLTTEYALDQLMAYPEATTVDGIVALSTERCGGRVVRRIEVAKLRGRPHLSGQHVMKIAAEGICITPRLEALTKANPLFEPRPERADFGLAELDEMTRGGLPTRSTTLLAGSTGVGKTLLSARFVAQGAAQQQPSMLVSYSEPAGRLVGRAASVGIQLQPLIDSGALHLCYHAALDIEADDLVAELLESVQRHGVKRLVVDGIGELEDTLLDRRRSRSLLTSLIIRLRDLDVTTIFIKEVSKVAGPELDFSDTPVSVTAENLILLRHIELRGKLRRMVSILKMRDSWYDPTLREFDIGDPGIRLLEPLHFAEGLLTGVARPLAAG